MTLQANARLTGGLLRRIRFGRPFVKFLERLSGRHTRLTGRTTRLRLGAGRCIRITGRTVTWPVTTGSWRTIALPVATRAGAAGRTVTVTASVTASVTIGSTVAAGFVALAGRSRPGATHIGIRAIQAVTGRQADFKLDDFIPLLIAAIPLGDGKEFAQATTGVEGRRGRQGGRNFSHVLIMTHLGCVDKTSVKR